MRAKPAEYRTVYFIDRFAHTVHPVRCRLTPRTIWLPTDHRLPDELMDRTLQGVGDKGQVPMCFAEGYPMTLAFFTLAEALSACEKGAMEDLSAAQEEVARCQRVVESIQSTQSYDTAQSP